MLKNVNLSIAFSFTKFSWSQIKNKRNDLLNHPLVTSLIFCKWTAYGRHFYYGNLFLYVLYLVFLTVYTLTQIPPYRSREINSDPNSDNPKYEREKNCIKTNPDEDNLCEVKSIWVVISGLITIVASVIRIIIEFLQLWFQKHKYISLQNLIELALFALSIFFTVNVFFEEKLISSTEWQIGVFCLLVAWMNFMMFLRKVRISGNLCCSLKYPVLCCQNL